MNKVLFLYIILFSELMYGQDTTNGRLNISAYLEFYYGYDFSNPLGHLRPPFVISHNRHNEVNLNLGFVKASVLDKNYRANAAFMSGSYAQYNLGHEPGVLKQIFEANAGIKIGKGRELWIDAGIFPSHIGFESAIGMQCWNLTRSVLADNSPYYETGIKAGYTSDNKKLYLAFLYLNGWQRIQRLPGNQTPAFGTQATFQHNNLTVNWSTFAGNDQPGGTVLWRYFSNTYLIWQMTGTFGLIAGYDFGIQQRSPRSGLYDHWYSPVLILRLSAGDKTKMAVRGEYYSDMSGVIVNAYLPSGFSTWGLSANVDYSLAQNVLIRFEGRLFRSRYPIFVVSSATSVLVISSLAVTF